MSNNRIVIKTDLTQNYQKSGIYNTWQFVDNYKRMLSRIKENFVWEIMRIIIDNANNYLDYSTNGFQTSKIRNSWSINKISDNVYELRNEDNELVKGGNKYNRNINRVGLSILAEFGTGIVGQQDPHEVASEIGYQYDINEHGEDGWSFYNATVGLSLKGFKGYEGHRFLYNAMLDFRDGIKPTYDEAIKIWNKCVKKTVAYANKFGVK